MREVQYDYSKFKSAGRGIYSQEETDFQDEIKKDENVIYFFYKIDGNKKECLYIGETARTLYKRCYVNTPKEKNQPWLKNGNCVYILSLRHKFMDTLKIKVSETKSKRMSSVNPYAFCYLSELLSLCRKTEAISILYTISISRSLPVIFGKPPTMIRSISS